MSRPWLRRYPEGVPHAIDPDRYRSLAALLDESFQQHSKRPAMVCMERWASYGDLDRLSSALGAWLQARNLVKGARVAVMLPNVPQFMVAMAAILRAGFTVVNVNPLYTERELHHQLQDSGAEAIVVLENFAHTLAEVVDQTQVRHIVICSVGDMLGTWYGRWVTFALRHLARKVPAFQLPYRGPAGERNICTFRQAIQHGESLSFKRVDIQGDDLAFLQYTGGTTGLSKGAMLTHRNVVAAVLQADAWFSPALGKVGDRRNINSIAALPLYHIFALSLSLLSVRWGAHLTLVPNPRDVPGLIDVLKRRPFHIFPAVNTLFNALLNDARIRQVDFSQLAVSQAGGMAASEGTARQWQSVTGSTMVEGWGMSETCAIGTNNPLNQTAFNGTIGLPLPGIDIAIKDEAGQDLKAGEQGEICIRGPNVMQGYYGQPSETEQAFTADGFMHTGDIGFMDADGFTRIVDRKKDMILVSGFNVFPTELENVISLCPGVLECAAVGTPDEKQGEAIKLFVVRSDPSLREEDVARYCHDNLTGYKRPRHIEFRDELPKSNVGKILRRALRPQ